MTYKEYLGEPMSEMAHKLLHTDAAAWNLIPEFHTSYPHVPDVGRRIVHIVSGIAEGIFELAADAEHRMSAAFRHYLRQRRVSPGPPDHIRQVSVIRHYRIVRSDPDLPRVRQYRIAHRR